MALIVQKFGGTSVADVDKIKGVARKAARLYQEGNQVVLVVSAMGKSTDHLLDLMYRLTKNPPERELDMLMSTGEQVSISLLSTAFHTMGIEAVSLTGFQAGIKTDSNHTRARIREIETERIEKELEKGKIVVVAGFQGIDPQGEITTLGRGGSDTTAVALAAALKADLCEIFTDVKGIYTLDPNMVPAARKLPFISYDEMLEMANLGARVMHPRAVELGKQYKLKIHVRSSFDEEEGTIIREVTSVEEKYIVSGIACDVNLAKVAIVGVPDRPGIAANIFNTIAAAGISVDLIVQSIRKDEENDILFSVNKEDLNKTLSILEKISDKVGAKEVFYDEEVAKISIIGAGMANVPGVAATMFKALADRDINIEIISTSEIKVSCLIKKDRINDAAEAVHEAFELGEDQASLT
ncbi:MAG: aspartate kinase [Candidatus Syntrophonatronum acetioxidans]|uniref:Aspartokinase n=1 Tax=Candidatus Syntrophonatronum acetioxidans TaxID=1795816 RepID=A0A424YA22_9FIRM|nr:MAG: aspartate kinase [Candidatus Syntrophonatronum acetioxidans]